MKNPMRLVRTIFFAAITGLFLSGCADGIGRGGIKEGTIEYKAVPVDPNDDMAAIAPSKMTVKFKNNLFNAEMAAGFGMANMSFVSDPGKKEFLSMVNLIGQKYASKMGPDSVKYYNHYFPDYDVVETPEKKMIAGFNCNKALIKFKDGSPAITIYYTKEIKIDHPNWSNAYYKVDGVLMEYELKKFGLALRFTASTVTESTIDDNVFVLNTEYKKIPNYQLEIMFKELDSN
ncbi:MAG: hypothetical protein FD123_3644 [Bacteroidetes bacterium]|nr:MAG: hypothetical protein FD123_3644 [Bacteroidota bacterium]